MRGRLSDICIKAGRGSKKTRGLACKAKEGGNTSLSETRSQKRRCGKRGVDKRRKENRTENQPHDALQSVRVLRDVGGEAVLWRGIYCHM
jgi:hypothetical protein